jgi:TetR/AcrR family transcriptional regulator
MPQASPQRSRAERTRAAVLEAAEAIFADKGFAATRLEDVADRVGIRRASIVYYFRDKQELYHAVLASVFGGLHARISEALSRPDPLAARIEACVGAWVDYVGARPSIARLILREVADAAPERRPAVIEHTQPFFELVRKQVYERAEGEDARLSPIDPVHLASTIAGATVFFVAAMPSLVPGLGFDPLSPGHLSTHREEVLRIVRRLLGTAGPRGTPRRTRRPSDTKE